MSAQVPSATARNAWREYAQGPYFLLLILLLYILLWAAHPKPFSASDPWSYSNFAHKITTGSYLGEDSAEVFLHRLGVIAPVALFYELFGVNAFSTSLWPLIATLLTTLLIWLALPVGLARPLAALLFLTAGPQFRQSVSLMPDIIVSAFMLAATFVLQKRRMALNSLAATAGLSFLTALLLFLAFLSKASAYWLLPFWLLLLLVDAWRRRRRLIIRFHLPLLAWSILLGLLYLGYNQHFWGDPLIRLHSIQGMSGHHLWSWANRPRAELIDRLTLGPLRMLVLHYVPAFALSAAALVLILGEDGRRGLLSLLDRGEAAPVTGVTPPALRFWAANYLLILLFMWFGSTSLTTYEPIELFPRMALPTLPAMAILGGYFLARLLDARPDQLFLAPWPLVIAVSTALLFLLLALAWQVRRDAGAAAYAAAAAGLLVLALGRIISRQGWRRLILAISLALLLLAPLAPSVYATWRTPEPDKRAMQAVKDFLAKTDGRVLLLVEDQRSAGPLAYYFGYDYPPRLTVRYFGDSDPQALRAYDRALLYINADRARFFTSAYGHPDYTAEMKALGSGGVLFDEDGVLVLEARQE